MHGRISRTTLNPPAIPDVRPSGESETNISPDEEGDKNESEEHKQARMRKNKSRLGSRNRAKQRKQA